jgi:superfamily II DNA/RNA helicase
MLLLTPELARGLDLPGVSHVFNLDVPGSSTEYLHRSGRLGRIGAGSGGVITTIVTPERVEDLAKIARELGITSQEQDVQVWRSNVLGEASSVEGAGDELDRSKKLLDDLFNMY